MHKCLKCGRTVADIVQIKDGCTCGSKVFVFSRSSTDDLPEGALNPAPPAPKKSSISFLPSISQALGALSHVGIRSPGPQPKNPAADEKSAIPHPSSSPSADPLFGENASPTSVPSGPSKSAPSAEPPPAPPASDDAESDDVSSIASPPIPSGSKPAADEFGSLKPDAGPIAAPPPELPEPAADRASSLSEAQAKLTPEFSPSAVASSIISDEDDPPEPGADYKEVWLAKGGRIDVVGTDSKEDESGIENVRQLSRGVFEVDLSALERGPLVVRDQEGVYYVRLPFEQPVPKKKK